MATVVASPGPRNAGSPVVVVMDMDVRFADSNSYGTGRPRLRHVPGTDPTSDDVSSGRERIARSHRWSRGGVEQRTPGAATGVPPDRVILASARGEYRGLRMPGTSWSKARWHPRLDVVVTTDELRVTGNDGTRVFRVADMVLASFSTSPQGALRVDFLEGPPLCIRLDDDGAVLEALRRRIWEYEKQFLLDGTDLDWALDVSTTRLAEADALLTEAMAGTGDDTGRGLRRNERQDLMRRSADLRREARLDALRGRRRRMQHLHVDEAGPSAGEDPSGTPPDSAGPATGSS